MVCVGDDGWHDDRLIELASEVSDNALAESVRLANGVVADVSPTQAARSIDDLPAAAEIAPILSGIASGLREIGSGTTRMFTGGTAKLIVWEPVDTAQRVLELLEAGGVEPLLPQPATNTVTVRIGRELALGDVRDLSLIATGYSLGKRAGTLGILGPTRMDYPTVMATVAEVASTLSRVLRQLNA
jgi:heat-inducible transcriptional repressor